jgi:3-oxoacid CoA-transferase subunit B
MPLTGEGVMSRIITDLCVLDVTPEGLRLVELAPGVRVEDVCQKTKARVLEPLEFWSHQL